VFFLTQKLLPLINDGGRIVNISSGLTRVTYPGSASYASMKGAVEVLTRYLAKELGPRHITVNTVAPCAVSTPQLVELGARDPALVERFVGIIPLGRAAEMAEVASLVSYVVSEQASFITGQVISVNGGSTMP
jgi:NAD(P)-dependent dehydrogenase (short-subunit alcohol dehydrogenase family)